MHLPDLVAVAQLLASVAERQRHGELAKRVKSLAELQLLMLVHEDGQDSLGSARISDHLVGEEEIGVCLVERLGLALF